MSRAAALAIAALLLPGCAQLSPRPHWSALWKDVRASLALQPEPEPEPELSDDPPAALPAPEGLRAVSGQYRAIPLKWDPLLTGDVGGYLVESAPSRDGPFTRLAAVRDRGTLSHVDGTDGSDLGDGETRFYRLRAFDSTGRLSANASEVVVGTTAPLPDPPEHLRAYSRQPREVPLSWSASDDPAVAGYVVERSPAVDGPFEVIAQLEGRHATTYVDSGLGDLRVFYYRVAARNPGGASGAPTVPVRAVTKPKPLPPLDVRVADLRLGDNVIEWEPNVEPDLVEYRLYRKRADGKRERVTSVTPDHTRADDSQVGSGEILAYAVAAVDRDGLSSRLSDWVSLESEGYDLDAHAEPDGVELRWDAREDEGFSGARVERTGWLGRTRTVTVDGGHYRDGDVSPGDHYRYVVVLLRADGSEAPPSRPLDVRVPEQAQPR